MKKLFKQRFILAVLMLVGMATQAGAQTSEETVTVNGATYQLKYESTWGYTQVDAYLLNLNGVTTAEFTVPPAITVGSRVYNVRGIKKSDGTTRSNTKITSLTFAATSLNSNDDGGLSLLGLTNLKKLYITGNTNMKISAPSLTDIYLTSLPGDNWARQVENRSQITLHVAGADESWIAEKTANGVAYWTDFKAIVPYSETEETIKVHVSVTNATFYGTGSEKVQDLSGSTATAVFEKPKFSDYTFRVESVGWSTLRHVLVNGKDVTSELSTASSTSKEYTAYTLSGDTYIQVVYDDPLMDVYFSASLGGKMSFTMNSGSWFVENSQEKADHLQGKNYEVTIRPNEGYVLATLWKNGTDITENLTEQQDAEGTYYTMTISNTQSAFYFCSFQKDPDAVGSTDYDLNGDGEINVSDIDKLIERINAQ
ncbi:MAG: hypothetical protein IJV36_02210 [Prevotella sp.]|nr:hypothetical protein [Prevotella sp.]